MKYEEPIMDVMKLYADDIIRTSGEGDDLHNGGIIDDGSFVPKQ